MKITVRVTSSGDCWAPEVPRIDLAACFPNGPGGERFDEASFRAQVKDCRAVLLGSDDRGAVCAFAALRLASFGEWMADNDRNDGTSASVSRAARTIRRRVRRGASASVRVDLANAVVCWRGRRFQTVRVRIRPDDRGVVSAERFDRDCALILADFCRAYSRKFEERGDPPLLFASETQALLEDLRARTKDEGGEKQLSKKAR